MINKFTKGLVDLIYGTRRVIRKYQNDNPSETVFAADATKSIMTAENQDIQRGLDWVTSQRTVVLLTDKNLICGKWTIPLDSIARAKLLKINSLFGSGQVLKIQTNNNENYQFGMQINPEWTVQNVLPLEIENGKITNSVFSIIVRILLVGYLLYWLYEKFMQN